MILIIEPFYSGHHMSLYLNSILKELQKKNSSYLLLTTEEASKSEIFISLDKLYKLKEKTIIFSNPKLLSNHIFLSNIINQFLWRIEISKCLNRIIIDNEIQFVYWNTFDFIEKSFWIFPLKKSLNSSAILMKISWLRRILDSKLPKIFKNLSFLLYGVLLNNTGLKKIFLIDEQLYDSFTVNKNNKFLNFINDPFLALEQKSFNDSNFQNYDTNRYIILVYGSISKRKGIDILYNLCLKLDLDTPIEIIIAGKVRKDYHLELKSILLKFRKLNINVKLINQWITLDLEFDLFRQCNFVWVCYERNFNGSSGVLFLASHFGKPVVTSNHGYISYIVNKYKIGLILNPEDLSMGAFRLNQLIHSKTLYSEYSNNAFQLSKYHTSEIFAKNICSNF